MTLDVSPLESAAAQLRKSFDYLHSDLARRDPDLREQFRAATIQAFEFTYELAVKTVRRRMAQIVPNPDALRGMDFADMMRDAADAGLVRDAPAFMRYRDMRNRTTHTYNAERAEETVAAMDEFLRDTRFLLAALRGRDDATD